MIKVREPEKPVRRVTKTVTTRNVTQTMTGGCCPTCGRPIAKTAAERQRDRRARLKRGSDVPPVPG